MNNMKTQNKITVYFDGLCKVCSREISHYQKQIGSSEIRFVDICSKNFDPTKEKVDPVAVHKVMHVRRQDGTLATRVDAFIEIWQALPKYKFLAQMAKSSVVHAGLETGYTLFSKIRPWLPRYKNQDDCSDSPYCEVNNA
jgi:predicted DCC family thiol-disulfide oxidoreductase YuxK